MNISQLSHNRPDKPFHSSGYANVSRGNAMGSMSTQSFGQRSDRDKSRLAVNRYRDSIVGQAYVPRSAQQTDGGDSAATARPPLSPPPLQYGRRTALVRSQPRQTFREPPVRHNPFS